MLQLGHRSWYEFFDFAVTTNLRSHRTIRNSTTSAGTAQAPPLDACERPRRREKDDVAEERQSPPQWKANMCAISDRDVRGHHIAIIGNQIAQAVDVSREPAAVTQARETK